tara:strand:+ start:203 stop:385 length:183 start_codon:yes stop_codon:yes gene_type:complete
MIKTEINQNFTKFFNVYAFGGFVAQFKGKVKANAFALELALKHKHNYFLNEKNETIETNK